MQPVLAFRVVASAGEDIYDWMNSMLVAQLVFCKWMTVTVPQKPAANTALCVLLGIT